MKKEGTTEVKINIIDKNKNISFKLKNKRLIDRKAINILRNNDISRPLFIKKDLFIFQIICK